MSQNIVPPPSPCSHPVVDEYQFNVPSESNNCWDGLNDGLETHWVMPNLPISGGMDSHMKHGYLKMEAIPFVCDERDYKVTFTENFNGNELNTDIWHIGWKGTFPNNLFINELTSIALPDFVEVSDGKLKLRVGPLEDGPQTIDIPDGNGNVNSVEVANGEGVIQTRNDINSPSRKDGGCVRLGRYTISAKALNTQKSDVIVSALWLFGWGGEVDLYEQCLGSNACGNMLSSFHQWALDDGNEGQHFQEIIDNPNADGEEDHVRHNIRTTDRGKYSGKYVEYQFERTNFKMSIRFDGHTIIELHRYARYDTEFCQFTPLECDEVEAALQEGNAWMTLSWNRWEKHFMDLILSTNANVFYPLEEEKTFNVDWVRFEHKTNSGKITGPDVVCNVASDEATFEIELDDVLMAPVSWEVSDPSVSWTQNDRGGFSANLSQVSSDRFELEVVTANRESCVDAMFRKEVFVGAPQNINFSARTAGCGNVTLFGDYPHGVGTYEWKIEPTDPTLSFTKESGENWLSIYPTNPNLKGGYGIRYFATVTNDCGSKTFESFYWVQGCEDYTIKTLSNPVKNNMQFEILNAGDIPAEGERFEVMLIDYGGGPVRSTESPSLGEFSIGGLKAGTYHLVATKKGGTGGTFSSVVIIQ